jgi:hypothetical protein
MIAFLKKLVGYFDKEKIPYMLSGSVAMSVYSLPRFTRDFDFVVHLKPENIQGLTTYFKDGYYCNEDAVIDAITRKSMFNIIDHASGYKADFIILKNEPYRITEFERRKAVNFQGITITIVSIEDLIISKLIWIQQIESSLQKEDIKILSALKDIDWAYINNWTASLKLNTFGLLK